MSLLLLNILPPVTVSHDFTKTVPGKSDVSVTAFTENGFLSALILIRYRCRSDLNQKYKSILVKSFHISLNRALSGVSDCFHLLINLVDMILKDSCWLANQRMREINKRINFTSLCQLSGCVRLSSYAILIGNNYINEDIGCAFIGIS